MKEATGEASMTGITIAIIAVIAVIAVPLVTGMINSTKNRACCANDGGSWYNNKCYQSSSCTVDAKGKVSCSGADYKPVCQ